MNPVYTLLIREYSEGDEWGQQLENARTDNNYYADIVDAANAGATYLLDTPIKQNPVTLLNTLKANRIASNDAEDGSGTTVSIIELTPYQSPKAGA